MNQDFDQALQTLAALQLKHDVRNILLSVSEPAGDVLITIREEGKGFCVFARVDSQTRKLVRLSVREAFPALSRRPHVSKLLATLATGIDRTK